jgi:hypothetical protein
MKNGKKLSKRKHLAFLAVITVVPAIFIVFLLEISVRIFVPNLKPIQEIITPVSPDAERLLPFLRPHYEARLTTSEYVMSMKHNSLGFRDSEHLKKRSEAITRVVIIGDSFTYGWGVDQDQTYPALLQPLLDGAGDRQYEILNMGIPDTGTVEARQIAQVAMTFDPQIIVLAMLLEDRWAVNGNDLVDNARQPQGEQASTAGRQPSAGVPTSIHNFLAGNSALYAYIMTRVGHIMRRQAIGMRKNQNRQELDAAWELTTGLLAELNDRAKAANVTFAVMRCPFYFDAQRGEPDRISRRLAELGHDLEIPVLDLLPGIQQLDTGSLYHQRDGHWTPAGNEAAAAIITPFIHSLTL